MIDLDGVNWLDAGAKVGFWVLSLLGTFFVGRYSKNREVMTAELGERLKEYRALANSIRDKAIAYWEADGRQPDIEAQLTSDLHRLIRLRVHCREVSHGFRSLYLVGLEENFHRTITDGLFASNGRVADSRRVESIRAIAEDIDFAAIDARRADLFLWRRRQR